MWKKISEKLPLYGLTMVSLFPLLDVFWASFSIIVLSATCLIYFLSDLKNRWSPDVKGFLIFSFPFYLYLVGYFYTSNSGEAIKTIETGLSLLLFPFLIFIMLGTKYYKTIIEFHSRILLVYSLSTCMLILVILGYLTNVGAISDLFDAEVYQNVSVNRGTDMVRFYIEHIGFIGEHPTYLGLLSLFSFLVSIYQYRFGKKVWMVILMLISTIGVLVSGSKMAIVTYVLIGILIGFLLVKSRRKRVWITLSIVGSFILMFILNPMIRLRYEQLLTTKFTPPTGLRYNSTNVRVGIFQCTKKVFQDAPIIGYGTGGYKDEMKECYLTYDTDAYTKAGGYFNTHNQYLSYALSNGIYGLVLFIGWILFLYGIAIRSKESLFIIAVFVFSIMFITENILERQTGVVLFSFVLPLLYIKSQKSHG